MNLKPDMDMRPSTNYWNPRDIPAMFSEHIEPQPLPSPAQRRALRQEMLSEGLWMRLRRMAQGFAALLHAHRWSGLLRAADVVMRDRAVRVNGLPDPEHALSRPDGFCALADDLSVGALMDIYARGIYADSGLTKASLWAPAQRRVIELDNYSLTRTHPRARQTALNFDTSFDTVLAQSNEQRVVRQSPVLLHAFAEAAEAGIVHSLELRDVNAALEGGLYGMAVGRVFIVHGFFARDIAVEDSLIEGFLAQLKAKQFKLVDFTPLSAFFHPAMQNMSRQQFAATVCDHLAGTRVGRWFIESESGPTEAAEAPVRSAA